MVIADRLRELLTIEKIAKHNLSFPRRRESSLNCPGFRLKAGMTDGGFVLKCLSLLFKEQ